MFLLDTNVISELRRADRADPNVFGWANRQVQTEFFISVISILEIEIGAQQRARNDEAQGRMLRRWIDEAVLTEFDGRILPVDTATAQRCASLHVPDRKPERDALIAATALVHSLTLITRNTRDFAATGVKLFNPWTVPT
jgi:predicted nucleic acid-binding protein